MLEFIFKYWLEILFGLIISVFTYYFKQLLKYKKKLDDTNKGIIVILKIEIIEKYNNYIKKNYITVEEKNSIIDLYNVYKKFECCDVVEGLMKKINSIPVK